MEQSEHFLRIEEMLKKAPFWKYAATGYSMDEQYILAVEESFFAPRDKWEELALQIVQDIYDFFYAVAEKSAKNALKMQERQIKLIEKWLALTGQRDKLNNKLITQALTGHFTWAQEIAATPNKEKKAYIEKLSDSKIKSLLGEKFMDLRPEIKPEKPAKKKLPEIRRTALYFDKEAKEYDCTWLLDATPEQWVIGNEPEKYEMQQHKGAFYESYMEKDLLHLSYIMENRFHLLAYYDYRSNRIPERVRGFWYLSALSMLRAYQLYKKGYPVNHGNVEYYFQRYEAANTGVWEFYVQMIYAYAAGGDELLPQLQHFANKEERMETEILLKLFTGGDYEELIPAIETWTNEWERDCFLAILKAEKARNEADTVLEKQYKKEVRKQVIAQIRSDRKGHELNPVFVDAHAYAWLRLAKERGLDLEPVVAAEVLDGDLTMTPLDKNVWKLPLHEEIELWLKYREA